MNSTGFDCARKGASAQPTSGWGGDAFDSGGHPCGLGGDGSRGENYECWSTRVAERQGSARWKGVGVGLNPSKLQRCSLSRLSPESRARAESTLEACSYRVPRRAFPSALSRRCRPRFRYAFLPCLSRRSSINGGSSWIDRFRRAENFPPSSPSYAWWWIVQRDSKNLSTLGPSTCFDSREEKHPETRTRRSVRIAKKGSSATMFPKGFRKAKRVTNVPGKSGWL